MSYIPDKNLEEIRKINSSVINDDGTVKSFKEQLLEFEYGYYDATKRFIVSSDSSVLVKMGAENFPLTMQPTFFKKIEIKHPSIDIRTVVEIPTLIKENCVLGLDSYMRSSDGKAMYLDVNSLNEVPVFVAFGLNKKDVNISINEIASIYERKILHTLLLKLILRD